MFFNIYVPTPNYPSTIQTPTLTTTEIDPEFHPENQFQTKFTDPEHKIEYRGRGWYRYLA